MSKTKWCAKPIYVLVALALVLSLGITALPMAGMVEANGTAITEVWEDSEEPAGPLAGFAAGSLQNVYVDGYSGNDGNLGTEAAPFATIQKGVDEVANGGNVYVKEGEGTYVENVWIEKSLSLIGDGSDKVTINSAVDTSYGDSYTWAIIRAKEADAEPGYTVNISGFTIDGVGHTMYAGIKFGGDATSAAPVMTHGSIHDCVIKNCNLPAAAKGYGIDIQNSNTTEIYSNTISDCSQALIAITGRNADILVYSNVLYNGDGNDGIYVGYDATATIYNNQIYDCSATFAAVDITDAVVRKYDWWVNEGCHATIYENDIHDNARGIQVGYPDISPYDGVDKSTATAYANKIHRNSYYGIYEVNLVEGYDVLAEKNWWGDATGPSHGSNPHGTGQGGDAVSDNVDFMPWYATDTTTPTTENISVDHPGGSIIAYSDTIQGGIDAALDGDTINVAAGTYDEQVVINKDLTLQGVDNPIIKAPSSPGTFIIAESSKKWEPVVFAYGGMDDGSGNISGSDTVNVSISGFTVDGDVRAPTQRSAGILLRNVVSTGSISNNTVQNFYLNKETFGIIAYGNCDLVISGNTVTSYGRAGIAVNGDGNHAVITGNTVEGVHPEIETTWALNGIQISWGATGEIRDNIVSGNGWAGEEWAGTGILPFGSDGVIVEENHVFENETGIAPSGGWGETANNIVVRNNVIEDNDYGISVQMDVHNTLIESNDIKNNTYGIEEFQYDGDVPSGTQVHYNNIVDNQEYGVVNWDVPETLDATNNWWGANDGPDDDDGVINGSGDKVSTNVDADPWIQFTLQANPAQIAADGSSTSSLWARLKNSDDTIVAPDARLGQLPEFAKVTFTTDAGTVGSTSVTHDLSDDGDANATLTSSTTVETATVTAQAKDAFDNPISGATDSITVEFIAGPTATVAIVANPINVPADGTSTSTLTATVNDEYGNPVADGTDVVFDTDHGTLSSSTVTKQTTSGVATATLTSESSTETIIATVTATVNGISDTVAVFFVPEGGTQVEESKTETITGSGTMEDTPIGGDVAIDATGDHTITTAKYEDNPGGTPTFEATGDYYDVHLDDDTGVDSLTIEFCPAAEGTVIYYWDGASWRRCSEQSYSDGCIVVTITADTFPSLSDLSGLPFGSGTPPPPAPVGGEAYPVNKLAILAPWITVGMAIIAGSFIVMRRRRAQG